LKCDLEIYVGIYLLIAIFFGMSNILKTAAYWHMLRVRYMMTPALQDAFTRINLTIMSVLNHDKCPD